MVEGTPLAGGVGGALFLPPENCSDTTPVLGSHLEAASSYVPVEFSEGLGAVGDQG